MKSVKSKVIIGITASALILGGIGIASIQMIDADAAQSPFVHLPQEKKEQEEKMERKANEAREKLGKNAVEMKKVDEQKKEKEMKSKSPDDTPIKTEIIDFVDDPLRNKVIYFSNGWITPTENGKSVSVSAGALVEDPEQGVVLVRHYDEKRFMSDSNIVKTPNKVGKVTIKDYDGMILTLVTKDGKELTFNVASEKFN